jgi:phosphoglycolate phosphatase-like HAD superfamily hydrolase
LFLREILETLSTVKKALLIFDIDGTLTDTKKVDDKCFKNSFKKIFGIDIENQNWEDFMNVTDWGITEEIALRELKRMPTAVEYESMIDTFVGALIHEKKMDGSQFNEIAGAAGFFNSLKQNGYCLSIATGGWQRSALMKLQAIGLNILKIPFSTSNHRKTREDIVNHVIKLSEESYNAKFGRIIYFGDGVWDFTTSKKLGIDFIGIDQKKIIN